MPKVKAGRINELIPSLPLTGNHPNHNEKIKINSNEVNKNDIFLALKGTKFHGNKFINNSFKNGAKYCLSLIHI